MGFEILEEGQIDYAYFTSSIDSGTVRGLIDVNYEEEQFMIHIIHPTLIPEKKRVQISELIARINYEDLFGGFVLGFSDGKIGYQCGFLFEKDNELITKKHLHRYFEKAIEKMDYYFPVILKVGFGDKEPSLALDELEHQIDPRWN